METAPGRGAPRPRVCYLVSHGFAARMVLHSDLVAELAAAGMDTIVLAPGSAGDSLRQFVGPHLSLVTAAVEKSRWRMALGDARRYLREPLRDNAALWSRHLYYAHGLAGRYAKYRAKINYLAHRLFYRSRTVHKLFDRLDRGQHRSAELRRCLAAGAPDLVVSTYPVTSFEVAALLEAAALGIPTVGHLLSWDNITCKGRFTEVPESFVSWGPIMSAELREHYGVADQRIHECGVPHFDAHQRLVDPALLRRILNDLNLDSGKPYLFFGMSAPIFAPHEIEIVEWLADELRRNRFGPDLQLIVRPHPQNVQGNMADRTWLQRLDALRGPRVATNLPLLAEGGLSWDMQQEDLAILVNLLSGCSLCLNSGSTLSIDALAHDKPVVVTLFDADRELPWWRSARRIREFPHYRKLLALGGIRPVGSLAELASEIDAYLANGCRDEAERRESLRQECGSIDGGASRRVARALSRILGESRDARRAAMERPQTPGRGG